jgi:hypothetical protein
VGYLRIFKDISWIIEVDGRVAQRFCERKPRNRYQKNRNAKQGRTRCTKWVTGSFRVLGQDYLGDKSVYFSGVTIFHPLRKAKQKRTREPL